MTANPIESVISHYPFMILDGAMATELERKGCNLADPLWSARVLLNSLNSLLLYTMIISKQERIASSRPVTRQPLKDSGTKA